MKYIINDWGKIKIQICKRNWIEIIYGNLFLRMKVKDIESLKPYSEKINLNGQDYKMPNSYELVKMIMGNENIKLNGGDKNENKKD